MISLGCIGTAYCPNCKEIKTGTCLCALVCPDCKNQLEMPEDRKKAIEKWASSFKDFKIEYPASFQNADSFPEIPILFKE